MSTDDLADRIAAVLRQHVWVPRSEGSIFGVCSCGVLPGRSMDRHQADAVVALLVRAERIRVQR